jgi:hypothetical protein
MGAKSAPGTAARAGDDVQRRILASMTPEQKVRVAFRLYWSARRLKEASIRTFHPELTDDEIRRRVNESFLNARD